VEETRGKMSRAPKDGYEYVLAFGDENHAVFFVAWVSSKSSEQKGPRLWKPTFFRLDSVLVGDYRVYDWMKDTLDDRGEEQCM
jgi:hypothetical protein